MKLRLSQLFLNPPLDCGDTESEETTLQNISQARWIVVKCPVSEGGKSILRVDKVGILTTLLYGLFIFLNGANYQSAKLIVRVRVTRLNC